MNLRIGCVKYLNAQPLIHGWDEPVVFDHPTALCEKLSAGDLDVALVSSFEYLRDPIYSIVDDIAVAANGPVHSVFVAHLSEVDALDMDRQCLRRRHASGSRKPVERPPTTACGRTRQ